MSTPRTYLDYLGDILHAIEDIAAFTHGMDAATFGADRRTVYAVTRALEIIGEATKRIPDAVQVRYPQTPWRLMARLRDRIMHGYAAIIWQTVTQDLPPTYALIQTVLTQERSTDP